MDHQRDPLALYESVIAARSGRSWGEAHFDAGTYAFGAGLYAHARAHFAAAYDGPAELVGVEVRARAGVMLHKSIAMLQAPIDEGALRACVAGCLATEQLAFAAIGLAIVGRCRWSAGERDVARCDLEQAVELFERVGRIADVAVVLKRLATHAIEEGDPARARAYLDRGIARLRGTDRRPTWPLVLEQRLEELRAALPDTLRPRP